MPGTFAPSPPPTPPLSGTEAPGGHSDPSHIFARTPSHPASAASTGQQQHPGLIYDVGSWLSKAVAGSPLHFSGISSDKHEEAAGDSRSGMSGHKAGEQHRLAEGALGAEGHGREGHGDELEAPRLPSIIVSPSSPDSPKGRTPFLHSSHGSSTNTSRLANHSPSSTPTPVAPATAPASAPAAPAAPNHGIFSFLPSVSLPDMPSLPSTFNFNLNIGALMPKLSSPISFSLMPGSDNDRPALTSFRTGEGVGAGVGQEDEGEDGEDWEGQEEGEGGTRRPSVPKPNRYSMDLRMEEGTSGVRCWAVGRVLFTSFGGIVPRELLWRRLQFVAAVALGQASLGITGRRGLSANFVGMTSGIWARR